MQAIDTSVARPPDAPDAVRFDEVTFEAMGTMVHVIVAIAVESGTAGDELLSAARSAVEGAEQRLSRFRADSELSVVNDAAGKPVRVSTATLELATAALRAFEETDGAFDPLLGRMIERAGYDRDFAALSDRSAGADGRTPNDHSGPGWRAQQSPSQYTDGGQQRIRIDPVASTIEVTPGHALDLGGIAKGATADAVACQLMALGAAGCCVSIGGDLRVLGVGPDDGAWRVDLACPGASDGEAMRTVRLSDGAVCTSSTTKRRWQHRDGRPDGHHILDPSTGRSRHDGPTTVTIIAATATAAEIVTKWVFAGGPAAHFDTTGVVIDRAGGVTELPGFDDFSADGNSVCASRRPRAATPEPRTAS